MGAMERQTKYKWDLRASRSRLGSILKPLEMLSHKNVIVVLYILFTLLYSTTSVKRKDSDRKQLKAALNIKATNLSDGAAKVFLTNLYKNYFNETGQVKRTNTAIPEIIHSVQGTGMVLFTVFILNKLQHKCFACALSSVSKLRLR